MENMLDISREAFRDEALVRLSAVLHETRSATRRGFDNAVPASIAGLAEHTKRERNAEELLCAFQNGDYPHLAPAELNALVEDPLRTVRLAATGEGFLARIFGARLDEVVDSVARGAGISRTSAHVVLGLSAPMVLDALGKEAQTRKLTAKELSRFLAVQEKHAAEALPGTVAQVVSASAPVPKVRGGRQAPRREATVTNLRDRMRRPEAESPIGPRTTAQQATEAELPRRGPGRLWMIGAVILLALLAWFLAQLQPERVREPRLRSPQGQAPTDGPTRAPVIFVDLEE